MHPIPQTGSPDGDANMWFTSLLLSRAITKRLDIAGPGARDRALSGNNSRRVFDIVSSGLTLTPAGMTITQGKALQGGGIANAGSLTVSQCDIANNQALGGDNDGGDG